MSWDNWVILQWSWAKLTLNFVIFTKISKFFLEKINSFKHVFECKTLTYCKNFPQDPKISPNEGSSMTIPWFWYHLPCGKICHSSSFCAPGVPHKKGKCHSEPGWYFTKITNFEFNDSRWKFWVSLGHIRANFCSIITF